MMLFKQELIVNPVCLNYNWDISDILFLRCLLSAIWLDALDSQGTSSNHYRNLPRVHEIWETWLVKINKYKYAA